MQRDGVDTENMTMADFLCDFCMQEWTETRHLVEGHQGAAICSNCLTVAYTELMLHKVSDEPTPEEACVLCRETGRADPHWRSPVDDTKISCRRCIKLAAGVLHKDRDMEWSKPVGVAEGEPAADD